jgi:phosphoserine phosphatase
MKYKDFSPEIVNHISQKIETLQKIGHPLIAAFDADGTLWDTDIGEAFFDYLIKEKKISLPPSPWHHYLEMKSHNPVDAYFWLCEILAGHSVETIKIWAKEAIDNFKQLPIFPAQKKLIDLFFKKNVTIYIVTASVKWAVEPAAELLGIKNDYVLGVETLVTPDGIVSKKRIEPATYKKGKIEALLKKTGGKTPFFCCGNSTGDIDLLSAADLKLAVRSSAKQEGLLASEIELYNHAIQNKWLVHSFV